MPPPEANRDETSVENCWRAMQDRFGVAREDSVARKTSPDLKRRFLGFMN